MDDSAAIVIIRDLTDRKRAATAESRLASVVRSSHEAIIARTLDGVITDWNPGATVLYGYRPEEVIGRHTARPRAGRAGGPRRPRSSRRCGRGEVIGRHRSVRHRKDGTPGPGVDHVLPITDDSGEIVGAASISRAVSREEMTDAKIVGLLEAAPDAIVAIDAQRPHRARERPDLPPARLLARGTDRPAGRDPGARPNCATATSGSAPGTSRTPSAAPDGRRRPAAHGPTQGRQPVPGRHQPLLDGDRGGPARRGGHPGRVRAARRAGRARPAQGDRRGGAAGAPAAADPAAGEPRAAGRRRRARLQQPARGDRQLRGVRGRGGRRRRGGRPGHAGTR